MRARLRAAGPARRAFVTAAAVGLLGLAFGAGIVTAGRPGCHQLIAGTYFNPAGGIFNLSLDGTITGSLSETSQVNAGQGDTFLGQWQCRGRTITGRDLRWVDSSPRMLSRVDWSGTFTPHAGGTLTVHFEFARVPESATAEQVLAAPVLFDDDIIMTRIARP